MRIVKAWWRVTKPLHSSFFKLSPAVCKMSSASRTSLVGVVQMTSTANKADNFNQAASLIEKAKNRGAQVKCWGNPRENKRAFHLLFHSTSVLFVHYVNLEKSNNHLKNTLYEDTLYSNWSMYGLL